MTTKKARMIYPDDDVIIVMPQAVKPSPSGRPKPAPRPINKQAA